ncbi:hypothetical protein LJB42_004321 [Komagataella kurtzmanii]|nr:hypothetical protein LJB42_004321 [Komagataella kurtzmanii]
MFARSFFFQSRTLGSRLTALRFQSSAANKRLQELVEKMDQHPQCKEALARVGNIIKEKGYGATDPKKLSSISTQLKFLMDKDIRESLGNFKRELDNAGISLTPEDIKNFMGLYKDRLIK